MESSHALPASSRWSLPIEVASATSRGNWCKWTEQDGAYFLAVADPEKWLNHGLPDVRGCSPSDTAQILLAHLPERTQHAITSSFEEQTHASQSTSQISVRINRASFELTLIKQVDATYIYLRRDDKAAPIYDKSWDELEDAYHFFRGLFDQSPNVIFLEDWSKLKDHFDEVAASGVSDLRAWANALPDEEVLRLFKCIKILDVSDTATALYKAKDKHEVIGRLDEILELLEIPKLRKELGAIAAGDKVFKDDFTFKDLEGSVLGGEVSVTIVEGYEDSWKYVIASISEATSRIRNNEELKRVADTLRQSTELFRGTLNHVQMPISLSDEKGIIIEANKAYCAFYGQRREQIVGSHFLDQSASLLTKANRDRRMNQYSQFVEVGTSEEFEETLLTHQGLRTIDVVRGLYSRPDKQRWVVTSFYDITQLKSAEEQSRKLLQDERRLSDLRSRFISMVSHEFRTPLTSAKMSSGVLTKYADRLSKQMSLKHVDIIGRAISRLEDMIDGVLVISEAGAGKLSVEPKSINLCEYIEKLSQEWKTVHASTGITTELPDSDDLKIRADERLLYLALNNLVSNAVKYGNRSNPKVVLRVKPVDETRVCIEVEDNGIGIPREEQSEVFDSYYRAGNVGTVSGTGLGLVVVENAIKTLRGKIQLRSELGKGTTFSIDFQVETPSENT